MVTDLCIWRHTSQIKGVERDLKLADKIRKNPLEVLREFFAEIYRPPDLLSLLLSKGP
jgi:hypothetical protein